MIEVQSNKSIHMQNYSQSDLTKIMNDPKNSFGSCDIKNHIDRRGSVRKTLSAIISVGNKGNTTVLYSSSASVFINSSFGGSRMIQRMFISCLLFVICTIYYGNHKGMTIMTHNSMSNLLQQNNNNQNILGIFDQVGINKPSTTAITGRTLLHASNQLSNDDSTGITKATIASISTYVQKETERMIQSHHNNTSLSMYPCMNSERWLTSQRYGNINNDSFVTHDLVQHLILNLQNALTLNDDDDDDNNSDHGGSVMTAVLKQTICHKQSRFLKQPTSYNHFLSSDSSNESFYNDTRTVRLWAVKLIYLAIHYHQHRLAAPEAVVRYNRNEVIPPSMGTNKTCLIRSPQFLEQNYNVGIFDYECPDAKYIIMPLGGNGLGSNVRGGMVVAFLIGLSTDRIVLFVNNAEGANHNLHKKWTLASCPRNDYQCFFWPTSPCTLTNDEINSAYALTRDDYRKVIKENDQLKHIEHHKVWSFNTPFLPVVHLPSHAGERLYQHAINLISAVSKEKFPKYYALLLEAAETIRIADISRDGYNYAAANTKVQHALAFYSMRPNPSSAYELDQILNHIIPETFPPETSIGLPIRGIALFILMVCIYSCLSLTHAISLFF
jgi:hypothetical protein